MRWQTDDGKHIMYRRLNIKLPVNVHKTFRDVASKDGRPMQVILVSLINKWCSEQAPKKK